MKSLLTLVFAAFTALTAQGAALGPQNISVTCDAHELAPGSTARNGQVTLQLSSEGKYLNSAWAISVVWKGVDQAIVEPGSVCGVEVNAGCFENSRGWNNGVFSLTQACGTGGFDTRGLPHHATDLSITLATNASGVSHGRFYCAAHDVGNFANIELLNCK